MSKTPPTAVEINARELNWQDLDSVPVRICDVFVAQAGPDGHVLNCGMATPPLNVRGEIGPQDVRVQTVARIFLTGRKVQDLIKLLQENVKSRSQLYSPRSE